MNISITVPLLGCDKTENVHQVKDTFTLIERGKCNFYQKVRNSFEAGAKGVIIYNTEKSGVSVMPAGPFPVR
jgi:hypothetical protein